MDQALVGAGVGASIQVVLQNLLSGPIEKIKLVWDLDEDVTNLVDSLFMIQEFLSDAEMKQINSLAVQRWLHQLEEVAFEADVVLDEFRYELLRQEIEKRNKTSNAVTDFFVSGTSNLLLRNEMADKVKKLNKRLKAINEQAKDYGLDRAVIGVGQASAFGSVTPQIQTDSFSVEPNIIGREKDVSKIVDMLVTAPQDETFSVIPILGMGGIGKTTLVQQVFHHESITTHFDEKIWVCVSVNFDVMTLLKMILEIVTKGKGNAQECFIKEVVLKKIQESLARKRYLLVLDDVWNENSSEWDSFMSSLKGTCSSNGNCIVVTTRSEIVASNVETFPSYRLSSLQEDECWSIIKAKAFSKVDVPTQYEEIGKCIAQRCGGLPLAAKVVGGLLRSKSIDKWESMKNQLLEFGLDVIKILKLSYDHLPSSSYKKCFAYCSVFPQDFKINKEELIMLWMAEGFLQPQGEKDMEAVGDKIFDHFLQNSLFQEAERDEYGNITHGRMHDLVHDLAGTISGLITFREDDGSTCGYQARNLAVVIKESSYVKIEEKVKYIRTLSVKCKIFDNMFISFKQLHSLKLTCRYIKKLPDIIGELIHLRFLDMSGTRIEHLPSSIGKLYNLQTLLCSYISSRMEFPNTIVDLVSLRHLRISDFERLPPRIGKLTSLRTISCYKVGSDNGCGIGELGHLKNLEGILKIQNLEMVKNKDEAISANLFRKSNIFKLVFRWNASNRGRRNAEDVLDGLQPHSSLKCLEIHGYSGVSFPLWTMKMEVGNPRKGLHNLVNIKLIDCMHCEKIPMLGHLPCLKFLELNRMSNVQSIGIPFYGSENCSTSNLFPALEKLKLFEMPKLTEWVNVETAITSFPCLESLIIDSCPVLKVFPSYFPRLKHLVVVKVGAGFSLQNICRDTIYLQLIKIVSLPGLTCLPEDLFVKNQIFTDLCISDCPELTHLVRGFLGGGASLKILTINSCNNLEELPNNILQSIERLSIERCSKLKTIPYARGHPQGFKQLRELQISNCSGLTGLPSELFDSQGFLGGGASLKILTINSCNNLEELPNNILQSIERLSIERCSKLKTIPYARGHPQGFKQLRELQISNCSGLTGLPSELFDSCVFSLNTLALCELDNLELETLFHSLWRMNNLQHLILRGIPKLISFPMEEGICFLRSLRNLGIGKFSKSMNMVSFNDFLNGVLHENQHLKSLQLYGMKDWESLPDQIQHLTDLQSLSIYDFGIEALPEWLGNLSSLRSLYIINCEKIVHMPSTEAMQRLTKLVELYMKGCCPLMKVKCSPKESSPGADDNSEWSKISHLEFIKVDGTLLSTKGN